MIAIVRLLTALLIAYTSFCAWPALAQSEPLQELRPREARLAFLPPDELAAHLTRLLERASQPPYVLTETVRREFPGTFGIDVSHYDFDKFSGHNVPEQCKTQSGYDDPKCSCSLDWSSVKNSGLDFAYLKASDGKNTDLSFSKNWRALEAEHDAGRIYRGAYHFLRHNEVAKDQSAAFLQAVGAINGTRPKQLSPALDLEPIAVVIQPGSELDRTCPAKFRAKNGDKQVCDLWYTMSSSEIVGLVKAWISDVEQATGLKVVIYTTVSWWSTAIGDTGNDGVLKDRPIWMARYTDDNPKRGPSYVSTWGGSGKKWGMPPLPGVASYPAAGYTMAHFWQWTEDSRLTAHFPCNVGSSGGDTDLNWVPITGKDFNSVFLVNSESR
jgi:GH25 family lysozyme M1 (1,4-beta-N-acetylmuramidase)